ncbi:MAG: hypothetical protein NT004_03665 [Bacteroidetes bacterium]|nr:hypothetical protein [Bacteroidota bacterium]
MNKNKQVNLLAFLIAAVLLASCGVLTHPNEKIIIGTWRPVTVEKVVDSSAIQAEASLKGNTSAQKPGAAKPAGDGAVGRKDSELNRLVQMEQRATMEIFADKTAIKNYPGKPLRATWKMKGKGTRIVAKNLENNMTFTIEILEINKERIVVIEHAPVGDVKITYERQFDAN